VKAESKDAKQYMQVDDGTCEELSIDDSAVNDWRWVTNDNGGLVNSLSAGDHDFKVSVGDGAVLLDKILVTNELDCIPERDGSGCVELPLAFEVEGLSIAEKISDNRAITVALVNPQIKGVEITFSIDDGQQIKANEEPPFCLAKGSENECGVYDFSQLSTGEHSLKISARSQAGQQRSKTIPFNIGPAAELLDASPTELTNELPAVVFDVAGIQVNDIISGGREIASTIVEPINTGSVTYRINDTDILNRQAPSYCFENATTGTECEEWDSSLIPNGTYELTISAQASGYKETRKSYVFSVDNPEYNTGIDDSSPVQHEVILGNGTQKAFSVTSLDIPKGTVDDLSQITYSIDGERIATANVENTLVIFDTSKYPNGTYTLAATITRPAGDNEVLSSEVKIQNNLYTSAIAWVAKNKALSLLLFALFGLLVFAVVFFTTRYQRHRKFIKSHDMNDYDEKLEEVLFKFFNRMPHIKMKHGVGYGLIAVVIVALSPIVVYAFVSQEKASGIGFIAEAEFGDTSDNTDFTFDVEYVENDSNSSDDQPAARQYIRLTNDGSPAQKTAHNSGKNNSSSGSNGTDTTTDSSDSPGETTNNNPTSGGSGSSNNLGSGGSSSGSGGSSPSNPGSGSSNPTPPPVTSSCPIGGFGQHGPCIDNNFIPPSAAGRSTVRVDSVTPITSSNSGGEPGSFRSRCDYSHMNYDDAVLYRNQPGRAHLHTYFGNTRTTASSTSNSLLNSGNSTCSGGTFNRSAYWVPSIIDTSNGRPIRPNDDRSEYNSDLEIYYKLGYQGIGYQDVRPFPNGLQMIAGNASNATSPTPGSHTKFYCETSDFWSRFGSLPESSSIPSCQRNYFVVMTIDFPQCWDGVNLTTPNGRSHLTYGTWAPGYSPTTTGCPSSHPVGIPSVKMIVRWKVETNGTSTWKLASDNYSNGPGGYSGHADYIFAWEETAFPTVKRRCYEALLDCHYQLGDGRDPRGNRY